MKIEKLGRSVHTAILFYTFFNTHWFIYRWRSHKVIQNIIIPPPRSKVLENKIIFKGLMTLCHSFEHLWFLTFIHTMQSYFYSSSTIHWRLGLVFLYYHRFLAQQEEPPWGVEQTQQPTRYQRSYAAPQMSYAAPYWATPHPNWATPHPIELRRPYWGTPHRTLLSYAAPYWATPDPTELHRT